MQASSQSPDFAFHSEGKKVTLLEMTYYTAAKSTARYISQNFKSLWVSLAFTIHSEASLLATFPITVFVGAPGSRKCQQMMQEL